MKKVLVLLALTVALILCFAACGGEEPDHTHQYGEWITTKDPSCSQYGEQQRSCSCGAIDTRAIMPLSHNWTEATCTWPKTCEACKKTEGSANGHSFGSWQQTKAATCITEGELVRICSVCALEEKSSIDKAPNNHTYDDNYDTTCNNCGFTRPPICNHTNTKKLDAKDPTCTTPGSTEGLICADCQFTLEPATIIMPLDHDWAEATCLLPKTCKRNGCGVTEGPAKGHTPVIDPFVTPTYTTTGLTEGSHCDTCKMVLVEQEIIDVLEIKEYSITYILSGGTLNTALYSYNTDIGIPQIDMPEPTREAYNFDGWYTTAHYSEDSIVRHISKGTVGDITLYAKWSPTEYEITYNHIENNTNPTSYTIEDSLILSNPKWSGLIFTHWTDESGNTYAPNGDNTFFPKNTYGNLVLTAHWKTKRNIATPANADAEVFDVYIAEDGFVYFFYDLGTIEHVVLDENYNNPEQFFYKNGNVSETLKLSSTVTISEEMAETIANTISCSISSTVAWEKTVEWASTKTDKWNVQLGGSLGGEKGLSKRLGLKINGSYDFGKESSETDGWSKSQSHSISGEVTKEKSVTTSLAYKTEITSSVERTYDIASTLPDGYYAYVHAGNIRVIAVLSYDINAGTIYLDTYSYLDNMHSIIMYYKDVSQLNNPSVEGLDFAISENSKNTIVDYINTSYFVQYDANGGSGSMTPTMHSVGESQKLAINTYTKTGYAFNGWNTKSDGSGTSYTDEEVITNISSMGKSVTLYAQWKKCEYFVTFNTNGGSTIAQTTVKYGGTVVFADYEPTREGYVFEGWYEDPAFNNKYSDSYVHSTESDIIAYAKWTPREYECNISFSGEFLVECTPTIIITHHDGTKEIKTLTPHIEKYYLPMVGGTMDVVVAEFSYTLKYGDVVEVLSYQYVTTETKPVGAFGVTTGTMTIERVYQCQYQKTTIIGDTDIDIVFTKTETIY